MTKIKVLHVLPFPLSDGGIESYVLSILKFSDSDQFQQDLLIANSGRNGKFLTAVENHGCRIICFGDLKKHPIMARKIIVDTVASGYNVMHHHDSCIKTTIPLREAYNKRIPKRILHAHNSGVLGFRRNARHCLNKILIQGYVTDLIAVSKSAARFMSPFVSNDVKIIKNGIDLERFKFNNLARIHIREEYGIVDKFVIGVVARLEPIKNLKYVIELVHDLISIYPQLILMIVGSGQQEYTLKLYVKSLSASNFVILTGSQPNVQDYYSAFDMYMLPSIREGFSITTLEAQASGLQCIVSSGIPDEVRATDNVSFLPLDKEVWKTKFIHTMNKKIDRINSQVTLYEKGYSIQNSVEHIERIYLQQ